MISINNTSALRHRINMKRHCARLHNCILVSSASRESIPQLHVHSPRASETLGSVWDEHLFRDTTGFNQYYTTSSCREINQDITNCVTAPPFLAWQCSYNKTFFTDGIFLTVCNATLPKLGIFFLCCNLPSINTTLKGQVSSTLGCTIGSIEVGVVK